MSRSGYECRSDLFDRTLLPTGKRCEPNNHLGCRSRTSSHPGDEVRPAQEPYDILTADSATVALKLPATTAIDVVVFYERMPGTLGSVFLSQVRESYPDTVRILLSGPADVEDVVRAINQGEIYRFCLKPIQTVDLARVIRQAVQQKRLLAKSRRLLREYQRHVMVLDELERTHPGIAQLETDEDGTILVDDRDDGDIETLPREMDSTRRK